MNLDEKDLDLVESLSKVCVRTGLYRSKRLSESTNNNVFIKAENLQVTGAFKLRGSFYKISKMLKEKEVKGLICASAGNHGQGVAYSGNYYKIPTIVVLPKTTPFLKIDLIKSYGATCVMYGDTYDEACEYALKLNDEKGYEFIHPFNDLDVSYGQGSVAIEILQDMPDVDVILVPCGGGGLLSGICQIVKKYKPEVEVYGVEPYNASSVYEAIKNQKVTKLEKVDTIADGCAVKLAGDNVFENYNGFVKEIFRVQDSELISSFIDVIEESKFIAEPSGLISIAGAKYLNVTGKNVVCILSGGNFDIMSMSTLLVQGLKEKSRIFSFRVLLKDKPGELLHVANIVANNNGNVVALDHNQFRNFSKDNQVELDLTVEGFGLAHKEQIFNALKEEGYEIEERQKMVDDNTVY